MKRDYYRRLKEQQLLDRQLLQKQQAREYKEKIQKYIKTQVSEKITSLTEELIQSNIKLQSDLIKVT